MTVNMHTRKLWNESNILKSKIRTLNRRRISRFSRLRHFLKKIEGQLRNTLKPFPEFKTVIIQHKYGEYKRTFELLTLQIENSSQKISDNIKSPPMRLPTRPSPQCTIEEWVEYTEDLEDVYEEQQSRLWQCNKAQMLRLIEILDTTERINSLEIPEADNKREKAYRERLIHLQWQTQTIHHTITTSLSGRGVTPIKIKIGDYPDPTKTRITTREDNEKTDNIIVSKILEKGYRWSEDLVLRKTNITVKTGD